MLNNAIIKPVRASETGQDCLFLSLAVLLSLILYVGGLGFYSDDWAFLGWVSMSEDRSVFGLYNSVYSAHVAMRPVQMLFMAGLYRLFGSQPLGYHLVNAAILVSIVVLFYLVLLKLGQGRMLSLAVPVVYGLLPHYSTNRFWVSSFGINLCVAMYFLSLYCDLRMVQSKPGHVWGWKLLSIFSLLGSTLSYELALPLFLVNPLLVWCYGRQLSGSTLKKPWIRSKLFVLLSLNILMLIPVVAFKVLTATRLGNKTGMLGQMFDIARQAISLNYSEYDYGLNFRHAISVHYGDYGIGLPNVVWRILDNYPNLVLFASAVGMGLFVFSYLYRIARQCKTGLSNQGRMPRFLVWGLVIFVLGYAIFLTNYNVQFTPSGIANRTAMAAAAGVAVSLVGSISLVGVLLPAGRLRGSFCCLWVSLLCACGFLINNTLASFWTAAYRQEQEILADIRGRFPTLPPGTTLILDGICPYIGPAIVFESSWDLAGALMMYYQDKTLRADVVTPNLKIEEDGLSTSLYGTKHHYPYGKLLLYHFGRKITHQATNAQIARSYFQSVNPDFGNGCPRGHEGLGVPVF
jgi:hypothetical protein